jgi:hypothetical protein
LLLSSTPFVRPVAYRCNATVIIGTLVRPRTDPSLLCDLPGRSWLACKSWLLKQSQFDISKLSAVACAVVSAQLIRNRLKTAVAPAWRIHR